MRYNGFVLPLVLTVLIAISLSSLGIYSTQNRYFENFTTNDSQIQYLKRIKSLKAASISSKGNSWQTIVRNDIPLSGLYNINNLMTSSLSGRRAIDQKQLQIFNRVVNACDLPVSYVEKVLSFLEFYSEISIDFTMIDLLAFLDVPEKVISDIIVCFRFSTRSSRINIKYSSVEQMAALLDLSRSEAINIKSLIMNGRIETKSELLAYLGKKETINNLKKRHRNIMISDQIDHAATYWTFSNDTFAYFEKDFSTEQGWSIFSSTILWLPELK